MNKTNMTKGCYFNLIPSRRGQSMVEFAMILPLAVLILIGIFDLGRAFFAYIAITNAAREGVRVATFWPGKTSIEDINTAVENELADSPVIDVINLQPIKIECGSPPPPNTIYHDVATDVELKACPAMNPIRVTLTYNFDFILKFFIPTVDLVRSAEMLLP